LIGGAYATPVVGVGLSKTSESTEPFSPIPVAYLEYSPMKGLFIQAGKLPTIIGYKSALTYQNNNIQRGWFGTCNLNDGFYTLSTNHPKPALEASLGLTQNQTRWQVLPTRGS
jgi:hypothetical protein